MGSNPHPTNRRRLPQGAPPPSPEAAAPSLALGPAAAAGVHPPSEPWSAAATAWTRCRRGLQPLRRRHAMALPQPACAAVAPQRLCAGGRRRRGRRWRGAAPSAAAGWAVCEGKPSADGGLAGGVQPFLVSMRQFVCTTVLFPHFFCDSLCEIDYHR